MARPSIYSDNPRPQSFQSAHSCTRHGSLQPPQRNPATARFIIERANGNTESHVTRCFINEVSNQRKLQCSSKLTYNKIRKTVKIRFIRTLVTPPVASISFPFFSTQLSFSEWTFTDCLDWEKAEARIREWVVFWSCVRVINIAKSRSLATFFEKQPEKPLRLSVFLEFGVNLFFV